MSRLVYSVTRQVKFAKDFSLVDQIRRAVISVTSNIAEGFDAQSNAEFIRFLKYSRRSVSEIKNQLYVALDEQYITEKQFNDIYEKASKVSKLLHGFIKYLQTYKRKSYI